MRALLGFMTLLSLACASPVIPDGPGAWSNARALPSARQEVGAAAIDGLIYVVGGLALDRAAVDTLEAYDPIEDTWRALAPLPEPMHHPNTAQAGGRLYVAGALTGGFSADGRVLEYDPAQDSWTARAVLERWRGAAGTTSADGKIYILGGQERGAVSAASVFDPQTGQVQALPPLPRALDHLTAQAVDGQVYAIGGRDGGHTSEVWALVDGVWQARAPMPTSRAGLSSAVVEGQIYVFGGEGERAPKNGVFPHVEAYDPLSDTWRSMAPVPTPRHGAGAAAVDGRIFLLGGGDVAGYGAVNTHEVFTPER